MSQAQMPAMSIILVTPDDYETIRQTMGYLHRQTVRETLEIVIVAPSIDQLQPDSQGWNDFCHVEIVEVGKIASLAYARAVGIQRAHAAVIAMAEDHSFPDAGWAEALIQTHEQPWAAVGPVIGNANPETFISWADFLIGYGPWIEGRASGLMEHLPGHNSSYKRDILLSYGSRLASMLDAETIMHWDLRQKGHQLYLESSAKTAHVNFSLLHSWVLAQFYTGHLFASERAKGWSVLKRMLYAGGSPLIPFVRLQRILPHTLHAQLHQQFLGFLLPVLIFGLAVSAFGEMTGYLFGKADIQGRLINLEVKRIDHIRLLEKKKLFS